MALYACPGGPDNHPGAYFWRLTNGKVPKTFHADDTKWWLLELIAEKGTRIAWLKEALNPSAKLALFFCQMACSLEDGHDEHYYYDKGLEPPKRIQS